MQDKFWQSKNINMRFDRLEKLGEGGMGAVYKVMDKYLKKELAVKILKEVSDEQAVRLQREAIATAKLQHENILEVYDLALSEDNQPYLVLEYVTGENLSQLIHTHGSFTPSIAIDLFQQICRGMKHAHSKGVLHRDLKPSNVLIVDRPAESLQVKIADFGLARLKERESTVTQSGRGIGSPFYMSPEQADGGEIDERSDIYSMGCLMYETLDGNPPFVGESALETIAMHHTQTPPRLAQSSSSGDEAKQKDDVEYAELDKVPRSLDSIIQRCLAKDKEDRFASFEELEKELVDFVQHYERGSGAELSSPQAPEHVVIDSNEKKSQGSFVVASVLSVVLTAAGLYFLYPFLFNESANDKITVKADAGYYMPQGFVYSKTKSENYLEISVQLPISDSQIMEIINDKDVQELGKIDILRISDCPITGENFNLFGDISITDLSLKKCLISNEGLKKIAMIKSLRFLTFNECENLTDDGFINLRESKTLETINLETLSLTEEFFRNLSKIPNFKSIGFKGIDLTPVGVGYLKTCDKLEGLAIHFGAIKKKNPALKALGSLHRLKEFNAHKLLIGKAQFDRIEQIKADTIVFTDCQFDENVSTKQFLKFKRGQKLSIANCKFESPLNIDKLRQKYGAKHVAFKGLKIDKGPDTIQQIMEEENEHLEKNKEGQGNFFF